MHKTGMGRIHETERGVIGRAGKWQHDRSRRRSLVGKNRHARRLRRRARGFVRRWEIDPYQALPFDARIGAAAALAGIDFLSLAPRGNLTAGADHVEAPTVVAARDGLAVEPAVMH